MQGKKISLREGSGGKGGVQAGEAGVSKIFHEGGRRDESLAHFYA